MRRQVPTWMAAVVIVAVIVVIALVYFMAGRRGVSPVQPTGIPATPQKRGVSPYEKGTIPPGAPPFLKQRPGGQ